MTEFADYYAFEALQRLLLNLSRFDQKATSKTKKSWREKMLICERTMGYFHRRIVFVFCSSQEQWNDCRSYSWLFRDVESTVLSTEMSNIYDKWLPSPWVNQLTYSLYSKFKWAFYSRSPFSLFNLR